MGFCRLVSYFANYKIYMGNGGKVEKKNINGILYLEIEFQN